MKLALAFLAATLTFSFSASAFKTCDGNEVLLEDAIVTKLSCNTNNSSKVRIVDRGVAQKYSIDDGLCKLLSLSYAKAVYYNQLHADILVQIDEEYWGWSKTMTVKNLLRPHVVQGAAL